MGTADFKRIVLNRLHVILKQLRFRKNGSTFSAETNDVVLFVQLQSSSKTTSIKLVVTINLAVFSRTIAARIGNTREPNILDAQWRERIGFLLAEPHDKWWEISSEEESIKAGEELAEILERYALPQFSTVSSTEKLKRLWETGRSPGLTENERQQFLKALNGVSSATR